MKAMKAATGTLRTNHMAPVRMMMCVVALRKSDNLDLTLRFPSCFRIAKSMWFNMRKEKPPFAPDDTRMVGKFEVEGQIIRVYSRHHGWLIEDKPSLIASYVQGGRFRVGVAAVNVPPHSEREAMDDLRELISSVLRWRTKNVPEL